MAAHGGRTCKGSVGRTLFILAWLLVAAISVESVTSDLDYEDESPDDDDASAEHAAASAGNSNSGNPDAGDLLPGPHGASPLPLFLEEPKDSYIVKNSPATLRCSASGALDLNFKCSTSVPMRDVEKQSFNDPHTGVPHVEAVVNVSRNQVDEFFGDQFTCACIALSSHGKIRSRAATVTLAFIRKTFTEAPYPARIPLGGQMELRCLPPAGVPTPTVSWLKNGQSLFPTTDTSSGGIVGTAAGGPAASPPAPSPPVAGSGSSGAGGGVFVSGDGHLLIGRARLADQANYTCVAENIAGRRQADPVQLTVFVDGGWSDWSAWTKCGPPCGTGAQRRYRVCNSPAPTNGGAECPGHSSQRTTCEAECPGRTLSSGPQAKYDGVQSTEDEAAVVHVAAEKELHAALYVGLGVAFTVFSLVAVFLVRLLRRRTLGGRRAYTEASTEYPADFIHDTDKKGPDLTQTVAVTMPPCYHYPLPLPRSDSEHHYDEPHLATPSASSTCSSASASTSPSATSTRTVGSSRGNGSVTDSGVAMTTTSVTPAGARLALPECGVSLTVPEGALARGQEALLSLAVLTEDRHRPRLSDGQTLLSGVVQVGPPGLVLNKPAVLSLRHCAILGADWRLSVWASQDQPGDLAVCWKEVLAIGAETINTPAFVQLDSREMFLVSEQLSTVVLVGEPATGTAAKRLLVAVFAETRAGSTGSTRVYVLEDTGAALQTAERTERRLGSRLAATPQTLAFRAGAGALQLELEAGSATPGAPNAMHWRPIETQQIPFSHIWGCSTSQLHCAFSLSGVPADAPFRVRAAQVDDPTRGIVVMATPGRHVSPVSTLSASSNRAVTITASNARLTTCSVESTPLRLPKSLRLQLSHCLDPPNARGNDWRMLAQRLHVDRYITYFGTKPNPTDVILTLWEARSREPSSVADLMATLRLMGRQDAVQIMEKELGPMWV